MKKLMKTPKEKEKGRPTITKRDSPGAWMRLCVCCYVENDEDEMTVVSNYTELGERV